MASLGRASALYASRTSTMTSYYADGDDDDDEQDQLVQNGEDDPNDLRTNLDKTIDQIGMGSYQWMLLALCGLGWMADNMWLQAIAIVLPRVQQHYSVSDNYIGMVSASMFAGMMVGAIGWGTCSDLMGRSVAFNATLFFTSVFGILSAFSTSFTSLCVLLFFLGSAVGGSMPTDGTLLLEHMPQGKQYLVTALSVFFSFGAVFAAVVALLVVPRYSCPVGGTCDPDTQNQGWKYLLMTLGAITLIMFLARMVFFRLHESPRYLVHAGRPQEALESLQLISQFNGPDSHFPRDLEDVEDQAPAHTPSSPPSKADDVEAGGPVQAPRDYSSTAASPPTLEAHSFMTPTIEDRQIVFDAERPDPPITPVTPTRRPRLNRSSTSRRSTIYEQRVCSSLPAWIRLPLWKWWDRVMMVLSPEWRRITILMWGAWCCMSMAFTMFNVFLPKLLETPGKVDQPAQRPLEDTLWDVAIFTLGGCPGPLVGAYLVETPLGRRWSLAGSTFLTAFLCLLFALSESSWAIRISSMGISLTATTMWAVLYGWTPEIFGTQVRGTACGIASALSRIGGMIAPILGGVLLMIDRTVPVYTSVVIFVFAGICVLMLREGDGDSGRKAKNSGFAVH